MAYERSTRPRKHQSGSNLNSAASSESNRALCSANEPITERGKRRRALKTARRGGTQQKAA